MECPICDQDPCTCDREQRKKKKLEEKKQRQAEWITRRCPQCDQNLIREHITKLGTGPCKWCELGMTVARPRPSFALAGPELSLDEFGKDLFACIAAISGVETVRTQLAQPRIPLKPAQQADLERRERILIHKIAELLPLLPTGDQVEITLRYPWVVAL